MTETETAIALFDLLNRSLKLTHFLAMVGPEYQLATLNEAEQLMETLELPQKRQLMSYVEAIAASSKLEKGEVRDKAIALVDPWINPLF